MARDDSKRSTTASENKRESLIRRYPYVVILVGSVIFSLINLFNRNPTLAWSDVEWHDNVSQIFVSFILLWWVRITVRSKIKPQTFYLFFFGCASLVWLMTIKFFQEYFTKQISVLAAFELFLSVAGLLLITLGLVSWSKEFRLVIGKLRHRSSQYRVLSEKDSLTSLFNRRQYDSIMEQVVEQEEALSLILVDLDNFKTVNDQYGHPMGDRVIKRTSEILRAHIRISDYAFRMGGEEYALLYVRCPQELVVRRAQTIRQAIADEGFTTDDGTTFSITASMGVVHMGEDDGASTMYQRADAALYQAKADGRNRVVVT